MATLTTKYDLRQTVWAIRNFAMPVNIKCGACNGAGLVLLSGEKFSCPKCAGSGLIGWIEPEMWRVETCGTIGRVTAQSTDERFVGESDYPATHITYMLDATGIGSGTLWAETKLFASRADAQSECDRMNAEAEKATQ